ncbi:MAG: hypothetical protein KatS3mg095_0446 [Candidatus Parcubacteria bacterium]|nr:MAG: hypothetical protein KatS3mg095_0446 [Candidatus Parcubacteria bacterium]
MAKIYIQIDKEVNTDKFIVPIYLDTEGESVNAFEVKIKISDNLVFRDYLEKDSIINYWLEKPYVVEQDEINFSGITPGGYIGKKGLLVNLIFEAKQNGSAFIEISPSSQVLLNDGLGTKEKLITERYSFRLKQIQERKIVIQDNYPPEPFKIYLVSGKKLSLTADNKYYLVFDAKDKQSGIAYYEVKEGDYDFEKASSPYLLKDQSLRSYIYVKAADRAGNERVEILTPQRSFLPEEILLFGFFVIMGIIIYFFIKKRNN